MHFAVEPVKLLVKKLSVRVVKACGDQRAGSYFRHKICLAIQRENVASLRTGRDNAPERGHQLCGSPVGEQLLEVDSSNACGGLYDFIFQVTYLNV